MVRKCPHLVRHGKVAADGKSIEFKEMCGLMIRKIDPDAPPRPKLPFDETCSQVPFKKGFDYICCDVYQAVFKSKGIRNDVNSTSDMNFGAISANTITDMDLL